MSPVAFQGTPYLWGKGALVLQNGMDSAQVELLHRIKDEKELSSAINSMNLEMVELSGALYIWSRSIFDLAGSRKALGVWKSFPSSEFGEGRAVKLSSVWSEISEYHEHIYRMSGWSHKTRGFDEAQGVMSYTRQVTLRKPDGSTFTASVPASLKSPEKQPSLADLKEKGVREISVNDEDRKRLGFSQAEVVREFRYLRFGGPLNDLAGLKMQAVIVQHLSMELEKLDAEFQSERERITRVLKESDAKFGKIRKAGELSLTDLDNLRHSVGGLDGMSPDDLKACDIVDVTYVPTVNILFRLPSTPDQSNFRVVVARLDSLRSQSKPTKPVINP
jgi:hypothetical protein